MFLIKSTYHFYDCFDFSNVCVCETEDAAKQLIEKLNKIKEDLKNTEGYCVMSENVEFNFVEKAKFETEAHKYKEGYWVGKTNQFLYLINHGEHLDDFSKRYLNHEEATLWYEELELR